MKKYLKDFCIRGAMFAWGGPVILAIVWCILDMSGVINDLSVNQVVVGIISTTMMAFIAAGISIVYNIESLPKAFAGLIQMVVLYVDYLGFYLINGWIPLDKVWMFTLIFAIGFIAIWFAIYIPIRIKVFRMNRKLENVKLSL